MKCSSAIFTTMAILLLLEISYFTYVWFQGYYKYLIQFKNSDDLITLGDVNRNRTVASLSIQITPAIEPDNSKNLEKDSQKFFMWLNMHKRKIIFNLKQALQRDQNTLDYDLYNVTRKKCPNNNNTISITCDLKSKVGDIKTIFKNETMKPLRDYIPKEDLFGHATYDNCAIISSSGSLRNSNLGSFIDSHDFVLRFNNAPTIGYERDVGSKTSMRIVNSQVVAKPEFKFLTSSLYKGIMLLVWDPSKYSSTLQEWLNNTEYDFIDYYIQHRKMYSTTEFYILDPFYMWSMWDILQCRTGNTLIKPNPPSSAFVGLILLLSKCSNINMFEYIPSTRVTNRCHYYSHEMDKFCTYGVWHPLAAEKLLVLQLNTANDKMVYFRGYVSISGYNTANC